MLKAVLEDIGISNEAIEVMEMWCLLTVGFCCSVAKKVKCQLFASSTLLLGFQYHFKSDPIQSNQKSESITGTYHSDSKRANRGSECHPHHWEKGKNNS